MGRFTQNLREFFNRPDARTRDAFFAAIIANDAPAALDLMRRFAGIGNHPDQKGMTALHHAAAHGHMRLLQALVPLCADINRRDNKGETALHKAAAGGHENAIIHLVKRGAWVDKTSLDGATPLALAAQNGQARAVRLLLDYGADAEKQSRRDLAAYTPLQRAAQNDDAATVRTLLQHADVFRRGAYNRFHFERARNSARPAARAAINEWAAAQKHKPS